MYYNTTKLSDDWLQSELKTAKSQRDFLLRLFRHYPQLSSSMALKFFPRNTPITSVRRCMTDLMNESKVNKTSKLVPGLYGKPEFLYELATGQMQLPFQVEKTRKTIQPPIN